MLSAKDAKRFWSKVDKRGPDECWLWTACITSGPRGGYGKFDLRGKTMRASRISLEESLQMPLGPGRMALHRCDVKSCVNPAHLYSGTRKQNAADAIERGQIYRGVRVTVSRLDPDKVKKIRRLWHDGATQRALSEHFGVHQKSIWRVVHRKTWRHVA